MNLRNILAIIAGALGAGLTIAVVEMAGHALTPSDAGAVLFAVVAFGYGVGAVVASGIASRISSLRWPAVVACLILASLAVSNLFIVAHPMWFVPVAAVLMFAGYLVGRIGQPHRAATAGDQS